MGINPEDFKEYGDIPFDNYADIKKFLMDNEYKFVSDTDTEVIPNLIHYYYNQLRLVI